MGSNTFVNICLMYALTCCGIRFKVDTVEKGNRKMKGKGRIQDTTRTLVSTFTKSH